MFRIIRLPCNLGGVAYEERLQKGPQVLLDMLRACASVASAIVALIRLVWDILKDRKKQEHWICIWDDLYNGIGFVGDKTEPIRHCYQEEIEQLEVIGNVLDVEITLRDG